MPFGVSTIQRPSCRLTDCTGPRPGNGAPSCDLIDLAVAFARRRSRRGNRGWSSPAPPAMRAGGGGSTAAKRCAGRGTGSGAAPRADRLRRRNRAGDLGGLAARAGRRSWRSACAPSCSPASRFVFSVVISLSSLAIDCCIALLCSMAATSGLAGGGDDPPLASAPITAPSAAAKRHRSGKHAVALMPRADGEARPDLGGSSSA